MQVIKKFLEGTTAEFFLNDNNEIQVEFNNNIVSFKKLLLFAKKGDVDSISILKAVKKKMALENYGDNIVRFLKCYFAKYNKRLDVVIRGEGTDNEIIQYDDTE